MEPKFNYHQKIFIHFFFFYGFVGHFFFQLVEDITPTRYKKHQLTFFNKKKIYLLKIGKKDIAGKREHLMRISVYDRLLLEF